ncbi:hypothetical protein IC762_33715 [Bradyrhizobium genosp. L]|uniref:hypothetical protein n=1 Tax=Bradyrhizobium genosp. L TaxID=83637 RepID=UPI0018A31933|nr:hypothetical protein [Bradyrhizobium genosp. L]QPF84506.1 hypothetical protein IC762_33715 [Bradyrhizobium genosp. L]
MTKLKILGAVLVLATVKLMPASAQVSEPAAASAQDPNFSIYSDRRPGFSANAAMAETPPQDVLGPRISVRRHHSRHATRRH